MVGLLLNVLVFLVPAVMFYLYPASEVADVECVRGFATFFTIVAIAYLIANIVSFFQIHQKQVKNIEMIEEHINKKRIYEEERDEIVEQAKLYLGEKYPDHEKELFEIMASRDNNSIINILPAFPEIKTSEVLTSLITKIQSLHRNVYSEDHRIEELKRAIRVRKRDIYTMNWFLPTYEENKS